MYVARATLQPLQQKCIFSLCVINVWTCGPPGQSQLFDESKHERALLGADVKMNFNESNKKKKKTNRFRLQLKIHGRFGRAQVSPSKMQRIWMFEHWTYGWCLNDDTNSFKLFVLRLADADAATHIKSAAAQYEMVWVWISLKWKSFDCIVSVQIFTE